MLHSIQLPFIHWCFSITQLGMNGYSPLLSNQFSNCTVCFSACMCLIDYTHFLQSRQLAEEEWERREEKWRYTPSYLPKHLPFTQSTPHYEVQHSKGAKYLGKGAKYLGKGGSTTSGFSGQLEARSFAFSGQLEIWPESMHSPKLDVSGEILSTLVEAVEGLLVSTITGFRLRNLLPIFMAAALPNSDC